MIKAHVVVVNDAGLHARPATLFVKAAQRFESDIKITNVTRGSAPANAKSILHVLKSAVASGHSITIEATGDDEAEAVSALVELIETNLDQ